MLGTILVIIGYLNNIPFLSYFLVKFMLYILNKYVPFNAGRYKISINELYINNTPTEAKLYLKYNSMDSNIISSFEIESILFEINGTSKEGYRAVYPIDDKYNLKRIPQESYKQERNIFYNIEKQLNQVNINSFKLHFPDNLFLNNSANAKFDINFKIKGVYLCKYKKEFIGTLNNVYISMYWIN